MPSHHLRGLTPEQFLVLADTFCERTQTTIADYAALAACSATTNPRFHGIPVHRNIQDAARSVRATILALAPLEKNNAFFADVAATALLRHNS